MKLARLRPKLPNRYLSSADPPLRARTQRRIPSAGARSGVLVRLALRSHAIGRCFRHRSRNHDLFAVGNLRQSVSLLVRRARSPFFSDSQTPMQLSATSRARSMTELGADVCADCSNVSSTSPTLAAHRADRVFSRLGSNPSVELARSVTRSSPVAVRSISTTRQSEYADRAPKAKTLGCAPVFILCLAAKVRKPCKR